MCCDSAVRRGGIAGNRLAGNRDLYPRRKQELSTLHPQSGGLQRKAEKVRLFGLIAVGSAQSCDKYRPEIPVSGHCPPSHLSYVGGRTNFTQQICR